MRSPTLEEKFKYQRSGVKLVGFDQLEGWKAELPFYKFKCEEHGDVTNYLSGHYEVLRCPKCLEKHKTDNPKTL